MGQDALVEQGVYIGTHKTGYMGEYSQLPWNTVQHYFLATAVRQQMYVVVYHAMLCIRPCR